MHRKICLAKSSDDIAPYIVKQRHRDSKCIRKYVFRQYRTIFCQKPSSQYYIELNSATGTQNASENMSSQVIRRYRTIFLQQPSSQYYIELNSATGIQNALENI
jgi:hypothetical protein